MTVARSGKPVLGLVVLAVLGSLAVAGAKATWHLNGYSAALPALIAAAPDAPPTEVAVIDLTDILALTPFGSAVVPEPEAGPVKETTLDLVLKGVVVRDDADTSIAFIDYQGDTQSYSPGDIVAERAELINVATDQVTLTVDGQLQTLSFPDAVAGATAAAGPGVTGLDRLQAAIGDQTSAATEEAPPKTTDDYINMWRDRIIANPTEVLNAIGLIPTENGYIIAEQHDSGVGLAGLQAGDLVTSVNGQAVGNVDSDRLLYDEVAASGQARIEVMRAGRTIVMSFPLR